MTSSEKIYLTALSFLGKDASPNDLAPDDLACAESACDVLRASGVNIGVILSTQEMNKFLSTSPDWLKIDSPIRGDIIISPTGLGGKNGITHGHVGIVMDNGQIASNDSNIQNLGNFTLKYTLDSWKQRYQVLGGYPILFYALKAPEGPPVVPTEAEKVQVATEAVGVATEAIKTPALRSWASILLNLVLEFLNLK